MKRCSNSSVTKRKEVKITVRYHFIHVRMAITDTMDNSLCWQGCEATGTLIHCQEK